MDKAELSILSRIGMCLLCVQQAEYVLATTIKLVFDDPSINFVEQNDREWEKTLGSLLVRLKKSVRLERQFKERLFSYRKMRNTFIHDLSGVPKWDLSTEEGREVAEVFLFELMFTSLAITSLFTAVFSISAKEDFGVDIFEDESERRRALVSILEDKFGSKAREILSGRYYRRRDSLKATRVER